MPIIRSGMWAGTGGHTYYSQGGRVSPRLRMDERDDFYSEVAEEDDTEEVEPQYDLLGDWEA